MKSFIFLQAPTSSLGVLFYTFGLILVFFLLMNLDRRFREYVGRSIMRPFNFFADIRDRRLIPNAQTVLLSVISSGAIGIFLATLMTGFSLHEGSKIYFSKALPSTMYSVTNGVEWGFGTLVIVGSCVAFIGMVVFAALMRFAAMFIRGRYYFADTYNISVWSLEPLTLLLAFDLILPRMDMDHATATLALLVIAAMTLWCYFRILKGTGVLFDVYPTKIYGYGVALLALMGGIFYLMLR